MNKFILSWEKLKIQHRRIFALALLISFFFQIPLFAQEKIKELPIVEDDQTIEVNIHEEIVKDRESKRDSEVHGKPAAVSLSFFSRIQSAANEFFSSINPSLYEEDAVSAENIETHSSVEMADFAPEPATDCLPVTVQNEIARNAEADPSALISSVASPLKNFIRIVRSASDTLLGRNQEKNHDENELAKSEGDEADGDFVFEVPVFPLLPPLMGQQPENFNAQSIEEGVHPPVSPDHPGDADHDQNLNTFQRIKKSLTGVMGTALQSKAGQYLVGAGQDLYNAERYPFVFNYLFYFYRMGSIHLENILKEPISGGSLAALEIFSDFLVLSLKTKSMQVLAKKIFGKKNAKYVMPIMYTLSKLAHFGIDPKGQTVGLAAFMLARIPTSYLPKKLNFLKNLLNWAAYFVGQESGSFLLDKMITVPLVKYQYKNYLKKMATDKRTCNDLPEICAKRIFDVTFPGCHNCLHTKTANFPSFFVNNQPLLNFKEQLELGVKSLSLDYGMVNGKLMGVHGKSFTFQPLENYFKTLYDHIVKYPDNVYVILPEATTPIPFEAYKKALIDSKLIEFVAKNSTQVRTSTMGELIDDKVKVLTFIDDDKIETGSDENDGIVMYMEMIHTLWNTFFPQALFPKDEEAENFVDPCDRGYPGLSDYYGYEVFRVSDSNGVIPIRGAQLAYDHFRTKIVNYCTKSWNRAPSFLQFDAIGISGLKHVKMSTCFNAPEKCEIPGLYIPPQLEFTHVPNEEFIIEEGR